MTLRRGLNADYASQPCRGYAMPRCYLETCRVFCIPLQCSSVQLFLEVRIVIVEDLVVRDSSWSCAGVITQLGVGRLWLVIRPAVGLKGKPSNLP